jgi:hypothetical protein
VAPASISATEGAAFSGQVAALTAQCANPGNPQATIAWGDGGPSSRAAVTESGSQLAISGANTYPEEGGFTGTVTGSYTCSGALAPSPITFEVGLDATVADAQLTVTSGPNVTGDVIASESFSGQIAVFTDRDTAGVVSNYTADVDWGDGSTSLGTVVGSGDSWAIAGNHVYATAGSYPVAVRIYDRGGATAIATGLVQVAPPPARVVTLVAPHVGNGTAEVSLNLSRAGTVTILPLRRHHELLVAGRSIPVGKAGPLVVVLKPTPAARRLLGHGHTLDLEAKLEFAPSDGPTINTFIKVNFTNKYCDGMIYDFTGVEQSCIVPNGVRAVKVIAVGGRGGSVSEPCAEGLNCPFSDFGGQGGRGAFVVSPEVAVQPGETLYIEVGGNGGDTLANEQLCCGTGTAGAGGWNGGGAGQLPSSGAGSAGGGGASDVQTVSCAQLCDQGLGLGTLIALGSRLVVAGGGGGGASGGSTGFGDEASQGGSGGDAGWEGFPGGDITLTDFFGLTGTGGGGGFDGTGGAGGNGCHDGANGMVGAGGAGGNDTDSLGYVNGEFVNGYAGGGGGGGYAGGGGGSGGCIDFSDKENGGGGGGGGSSYGPPGTSVQVNMTDEQPHIQIIPIG